MGAGRTIHDPASRCSLEHMRLGGVRTQVLPTYVPHTRHSPAAGLAQVKAYEALLGEHEAHFEPWFSPEGGSGEKIRIALSVENAAAFFGDDEPVEVGLARLTEVQGRCGPLVYVSLTWALENRFGGGNGSQGVGLKDDGEALLEHMVSLGIPVDVSHASDKLASEVLDLLDKRLPEARVMASHCNFRAVKDHKRNLSDELAREVAARGGVIGLNLIRAFVGGGVEDFPAHVEHALALGLEDVVCLGADFFCPEDLPSKPKDSDHFFLDGYGTAQCHPKLQGLLGEAGVESGVLDKLTGANLERWLAGLG